MFLMAADQGMPAKFVDKAYWIQFLNHDTPFLHGMEKHSRLNNLPVIYLRFKGSGAVTTPLNCRCLQQNHLNLRREL